MRENVPDSGKIPSMITREEQPGGAAAYVLEAGPVRARILERGAVLAELHLPGRDGTLADVIVGYASPDGYRTDTAHMNAVVGRVAGRIRDASFDLDGQHFALAANAGPDQLHGGSEGLHQATFTGAIEDESLVLRHRSPAGHMGFPGNLDVRVVYTLRPRGLEIVLEATSDAPTPVNLTHHAYFNLAGPDSESVLEHQLQVASRKIAPNDARLLPTGTFEDVAGRHLDLRTARRLGEVVEAERATPRGGLDHSYALEPAVERSGRRLPPGTLREVARLCDPGSGRQLTLTTGAACLQVYSANSLHVATGGKRGALVPHGALCLEAQGFPDAVHHPTFPSVILRPPERYRNVIRFGFDTLE